jgi:heme/copper-type cytochrome/quinol oxidase subunit 2
MHDLAPIAGSVAGFVAGVIGFYVLARRGGPSRFRPALLAALYLWLLSSGLFVLLAPAFIAIPFLASDAYLAIGFFAVSLVAILVMAMLGAGLATIRRRNVEPFSETEGKPLPSLRLTAAMVTLVIMLFSGLILWSGYKSEDGRRRHRADLVAKNTLKYLAVCQEEYYANFDTYNNNLASLLENCGMKVDERIQLNLIGADVEKWSGTAASILTGRAFIYDTAQGGLLE